MQPFDPNAPITEAGQRPSRQLLDWMEGVVRAFGGAGNNIAEEAKDGVEAVAGVGATSGAKADAIKQGADRAQAAADDVLGQVVVVQQAQPQTAATQALLSQKLDQVDARVNDLENP